MIRDPSLVLEDSADVGSLFDMLLVTHPEPSRDGDAERASYQGDRSYQLCAHAGWRARRNRLVGTRLAAPSGQSHRSRLALVPCLAFAATASSPK